MGLCAGLILIAALILLITVNGLAFFWPKPVAYIEIKNPVESDKGTTKTGGLLHGSRVRMLRHAKGQATEREWHIQTGNRERYGTSFVYVPASQIHRMDYPRDVVVLERVEYGPALGVPAALHVEGEPVLSADAPEFAARLRAVLTEIRRLHVQLRRLEKREIGQVNYRMEQLRLRERKQKISHPDDETHKLLEQERLVLQHQYDILAAEAKNLRETLNRRGFLRLTDFAGQTFELPLGSLLYAHFPNRMSYREKWVLFAERLVRFLIEDPREANTEGGIFPAIFGTFVMTLLMSMAVMPFGVLAAIYLREYARPGLLLQMVRISVNNLAGVPSIVFGVFGLGFFVYTVGGTIDRWFYPEALPTPTFGTGGLLWASLTLALLTVPVVIVASEEALASVPRSLRDGSLALGASKWQTIYRVVLPAAAPGIMTGLILAMARGAGEVAPLMLVGVVKLAPTLPVDGIFPFVHLERKFMHLGFHIYDLGFQSPDSDAARPIVFATALFLILLVLVLNLGALIVREHVRRKYATGAF